MIFTRRSPHARYRLELVLHTPTGDLDAAVRHIQDVMRRASSNRALKPSHLQDLRQTADEVYVARHQSIANATRRREARNRAHRKRVAQAQLERRIQELREAQDRMFLNDVRRRMAALRRR